MKRDISIVFSDLQKEVDKKISGLKLKSYTEKAGISDGIELFDIEDWQYQLAKATDSTTAAMVTSMIKNTLESADFEFIETDWGKLIAQATESSTSKITVSVDTIHNELIDLIDDTIKKNPLPQDLLRDKLREVINNKFDSVYNGSRADMIAQTTATHAQGTATVGVCEELNIGYVWMSQRDKSVRTSHFNADGQKPDKQGNFYIGGDVMKHPAGGSIAKENVRCRCYLFAQRKS